MHGTVNGLYLHIITSARKPPPVKTYKRLLISEAWRERGRELIQRHKLKQGSLHSKETDIENYLYLISSYLQRFPSGVAA